MTCTCSSLRIQEKDIIQIDYRFIIQVLGHLGYVRVFLASIVKLFLLVILFRGLFVLMSYLVTFRVSAMNEIEI